MKLLLKKNKKKKQKKQKNKKKKRPRKRKAFTAFTAEQRATIGKYASEHGNAAAVKFKADL